MRKLTFMLAALATALVLGAAPAQAVDIPYYTDGTWSSALPPGCCTLDNTSDPRTIRWGSAIEGADPPAEPRSGYDFSGIGSAGTPGSATVGTPFVIGDFDHLNFPVYGTFLATVDLLFDIYFPGAVPDSILGNVFAVTHDETLNSADPCPYGDSTGNGCDDRVTITSPGTLNLEFEYGGIKYFFSFLGFSEGGGNFNPEFITGEDQNNPAQLWGIITARPIPEPTTLLLLGTGLVVAASRLRRRR